MGLSIKGFASNLSGNITDIKKGFWDEFPNTPNKIAIWKWLLKNNIIDDNKAIGKCKFYCKGKCRRYFIDCPQPRTVSGRSKVC